MVIKQNTMLFSNRKKQEPLPTHLGFDWAGFNSFEKEFVSKWNGFSFFSHRDYIERMKTNHLVGPVVSHKSRSNNRVQNILQVSSYYAVHIMSTFLLYERYHFFSLLFVQFVLLWSSYLNPNHVCD